MVQHPEIHSGQVERPGCPGQPPAGGNRVELSLALAPEYYRNADGTYAWEKLGQGAYITQELTIDNTAPKVSDISLSLLEGRG